MIEFVAGITTAPRTENGESFSYLEDSMASFERAGWQPDTVVISMEPGAHPVRWDACADEYRVRWSAQPQRLGCYGNWAYACEQALDEALAAHIPWVMMLQDDVRWAPHAAQRAFAMLPSAEEASERKMAISLYTSPAMVSPANLRNFGEERLAPAYVERHSFWGALALLFPTSLADAILSAPRFRNHPRTDRLDVLLGWTILHDLGGELMVTLPSLTDHLGRISTLGRHRIKGIQKNRRGFGFQA